MSLPSIMNTILEDGNTRTFTYLYISILLFDFHWGQPWGFYSTTFGQNLAWQLWYHSLLLSPDSLYLPYLIPLWFGFLKRSGRFLYFRFLFQHGYLSLFLFILFINFGDNYKDAHAVWRGWFNGWAKRWAKNLDDSTRYLLPELESILVLSNLANWTHTHRQKGILDLYLILAHVYCRRLFWWLFWAEVMV